MALIGVVGFMTTQALFIDREESAPGEFIVGTLDMTVSGPGSSQAETLQVTGIGAQNMVQGGKSWQINNVGTLPGTFAFVLQNIRNFENGCNEPEAQADTSCDTPGEGQGELGSAVAVSLSITQGEETRQILSTTLSPNTNQTFADQWQENAGTILVPAGQTITVTLNWSTADSSYANEAQSDSVSFDTILTLQQVTPESQP